MDGQTGRPSGAMFPFGPLAPSIVHGSPCWPSSVSRGDGSAFLSFFCRHGPGPSKKAAHAHARSNAESLTPSFARGAPRAPAACSFRGGGAVRQCPTIIIINNESLTATDPCRRHPRGRRWSIAAASSLQRPPRPPTSPQRSPSSHSPRSPTPASPSPASRTRRPHAGAVPTPRGPGPPASSAGTPLSPSSPSST